MPHKNEFGRHIFSAGEISTFTLCPEAWRLNHIEKVPSKESPKTREGDQVHEDWSTDVKEAVFFARSKIIIYILIGLLIVFYLIRQSVRL